MLRVLYLDFDGVLHHEAVYRHPSRGTYVHQGHAPGRILFEWREQLVEALAAHPDVRIVLSTSWVRVLGFSRTVKQLGQPLAERVVGATHHSVHHGRTAYLGPHADALSLPRGQEVIRDVSRRQPTSWVALDDTDEGWPDNARGHLVLCPPDLGISDVGARLRLAELLEITSVNNPNRTLSG